MVRRRRLPGHSVGKKARLGFPGSVIFFSFALSLRPLYHAGILSSYSTRNDMRNINIISYANEKVSNSNRRHGTFAACGTKTDEMTNPFFSSYDTPYGVPPFDKIKNEHYVPAFEKGMQEHNADIDSIIGNTDALHLRTRYWPTKTAATF